MRETLNPLTSLRFFAALAIVFHHLAGNMWFEASAFSPYPLDSAVAFFFVLSGFVLHYSYGKRIDRVGWKGFALQRFMRIWPLHIVVIFTCGLWLTVPDVRFHLERQSVADVLQITFLLQAWNQDPIVFWGLNGPSWSISTELFFYLSFPVLALWLNRFGVLPFALATALFTSVWLYVATTLFYDAEKPLSALALGYISPAARIGEFCLGMALSLILSHRLDGLRRHQAWLWSTLEVVSLFAMVLSLRYMSQFGWTIGQSFGSVAGAWAGASGSLFSFALVIGVFAVGRGVLSSLLCNKAFVWLGTISFAMYLIHQPLIFHWKRNVVPALENPTLEAIGFFMVVIVFSAVLHNSIEKPGIKLGRRWSKRIGPNRQSRRFSDGA